MVAIPFELGPRERARACGIDALSDADLIALLLGTGLPGRPVGRLAADVLEASGGLLGLAREGALGADTVGLGEAKRARIDAAFALGRRVAALVALPRPPSLLDPAAVARWARAELGLHAHEELWAVVLDARHAPIGVRRLAQGSSLGCATSQRDVLRAVLRAGGSGFVLVHNHPSGDPTPSPEDTRTTLALARAGETIGVPLVDHVIVGNASHASLFELGLLDTPARSR